MLEVGQRVGSYRIVRPLGQGGMGAVFEAIHEEISRRVAIKVLHPQFAADAQVAQRFLNEARAVNLIEHPALVAVSDFGRLPDGTTFIVMELLAGETLRSRLQHAAERPPLDVLTVTRHIASALAAAHKKGVVHRDLKPDNVMLVPDPDFPGGERVKLLDFGIARVAPQGEATGHLTGTGAMLGTPMYMSPEQCRGTEQTTDRADVYALGVVLFQMITGRTPFVGQAGELMALHLMVEPPPVEELRPEVPRELAALVRSMLAKEPSARPSMDDIVAKLDQLGARNTQGGLRAAAAVPLGALGPGGSTLGRAAGQSATGAQRGTFLQRGPRAWLVPAAGLLLVGALVSAGVLLRPRARPGMAPPSEPRPKPSLVEPALALRTLAEFHDAAGAARYRLAEAAVWEAAAADLARALKQEGVPAHWRAAEALCLGRSLALKNKLAAAIEQLETAVQLEESWPDAHLMLASAYETAGRYDDALAAVHRAEALAPTWWLPVLAQAGAASAQNHMEEAVQAAHRALELAPDHPTILDALALALHAMHLDREAEEMAAKALAKDENLVGPRILRAELALERSDGATALEEAGRAVILAPNTPAAHLARADALLLLHRSQEARLAYQRFVEVADKVGDGGLPETHVKLVRKAVAAGKLPPTRKQQLSDLSRRSRPEAVKAAAGMRTSKTKTKVKNDGVEDLWR